MVRGNKSIFNITSHRFRVYIFLHLPAIIHVGWWSVLLQKKWLKIFLVLKKKYISHYWACLYKCMKMSMDKNVPVIILNLFLYFKNFYHPINITFLEKKNLGGLKNTYIWVCLYYEEKASDKRRPFRYPIEPIIQLYSWWYNALHSNQGVLTQKEVKWLSRTIHLNALPFL